MYYKNRFILTFYPEAINLSCAVHIPLLLGHNGVHIRIYE